MPAGQPNSGVSPPRIVIVGAGFGGLSTALGLARTAAQLFVIDRRNHHLFQPLLYQVATAALSPANIAGPIRHILSRQANATVLLGEVAGIDLDQRTVKLAHRRIRCDQPVLATGRGTPISATTKGSRLPPASRRSKTRP